MALRTAQEAPVSNDTIGDCNTSAWFLLKNVNSDIEDICRMEYVW